MCNKIFYSFLLPRALKRRTLSHTIICKVSFHESFVKGGEMAHMGKTLASFVAIDEIKKVQ
jgi:hypothetical protein